MAWTQASAGTFERPLGENETFIKLVGDPGLPMGREHWAVTATATFIPTGSWSLVDSNVSQVLRQAWKRLRFAQPSIAAVVSDDKVVYNVPNSTNLEAWADMTFTVVPEETTASGLIANRRPSLLAMLYYLPGSSELVLQTSHWRTDGIGIFHVLDVYFDLICQVASGVDEPITWGEEPVRLAPAIEEASNLPKNPTPELLTVAERCVSTFALTEGQVGVKYLGDSTTLPAGTRTRLLSLSEAETNAIINATKSRGISVTSALHASIASANYAFAENNDQNKPFTSTIRFGLRPYLSAPYNTHAYGSALYTSGYMHQVPSSQTWSQNATEFNKEYRKGYVTIMPAHRQYARLLSDLIRNMPPPTGPHPSNIDISSVGIVDTIIAPRHQIADAGVEVTSVSVGVEFLTRQMVCMVWTFRGRLNLHMCYNEAYHAADEVDEMLRFVVATTKSELGVSG